MRRRIRKGHTVLSVEPLKMVRYVAIRIRRSRRVLVCATFERGGFGVSSSI